MSIGQFLFFTIPLVVLFLMLNAFLIFGVLRKRLDETTAYLLPDTLTDTPETSPCAVSFNTAQGCSITAFVNYCSTQPDDEKVQSRCQEFCETLETKPSGSFLNISTVTQQPEDCGYMSYCGKFANYETSVFTKPILEPEFDQQHALCIAEAGVCDPTANQDNPLFGCLVELQIEQWCRSGFASTAQCEAFCDTDPQAQCGWL